MQLTKIKTADHDPKEDLHEGFLDNVKPEDLKDDFNTLLTTFMLTILWCIYVYFVGTPMSLYKQIQAGRQPCRVPGQDILSGAANG